jgi:hypothetical protein
MSFDRPDDKQAHTQGGDSSAALLADATNNGKHERTIVRGEKGNEGVETGGIPIKPGWQPKPGDLTEPPPSPSLPVIIFTHPPSHPHEDHRVPDGRHK